MRNSQDGEENRVALSDSNETTVDEGPKKLTMTDKLWVALAIVLLVILFLIIFIYGIF